MLEPDDLRYLRGLPRTSAVRPAHVSAAFEGETRQRERLKKAGLLTVRIDWDSSTATAELTEKGLAAIHAARMSREGAFWR